MARKIHHLFLQKPSTVCELHNLNLYFPGTFLYYHFVIILQPTYVIPTVPFSLASYNSVLISHLSDLCNILAYHVYHCITAGIMMRMETTKLVLMQFYLV